MRRSAFLGCAALAACGRVPRGAREISAARTLPPVRIAVLGDSLALGVGATHPDGGFIFRAYRRVLATRPGSRLDSYAMGGATALDVLRVQIPRLRDDAPQVVIVCVGGNDVVRRVPAATFAQRMRQLVAAVRYDHPNAKVIVCGVPDVGLSPLFAGFDAAALDELARADDAAARAVAHAAAARFVDVYATTRRARHDATTFLSDDRFHPSDRGYEALTAALTPVLDAVLLRD